jgi:plastocyanin
MHVVPCMKTKLITTLTVAAVALATAGVALPGATAPRLTGTVGPGFTISLKQNGKLVKTLKAGTYSIAVTDRADIHDFPLRGPGVNKVITSVSFKGTKTVTVALKKGTYTYMCDPHASSMHGSFKVT